VELITACWAQEPAERPHIQGTSPSPSPPLSPSPSFSLFLTVIVDIVISLRDLAIEKPMQAYSSEGRTGIAPTGSVVFVFTVYPSLLSYFCFDFSFLFFYKKSI
jgi:hypothetical protein